MNDKSTPSLYDITGDIKDINTMLVPKQFLDRLEAAEKDAARLDWLFSNPLIALDMIGCHRVNELHFVRREIDAAMKEQK